MDIHLRDLRYFVAVVEESGFTAAAARLYVSQPTISRQVRRLESELRAELFDRSAPGVHLTPAGKELLDAARALLATWDDAARTIRHSALVSTQTLRVGLQTGLGRGLYPAVSARFTALLPRWRLALQPQNWTDPSVGLRTGAVDVAFAWLPLPDDLAQRPIVVEPRWVALPAGHRLARASVVEFTDLLDEQFVAMPEEAGPARAFWLAVDERGGRPARIGAEAAGADATFEVVAAGGGVHLLAEGNAEIYQREGVVCRPVRGIAPATLAVAWNSLDERPAVAAFVAACVDTAGR